ncbi:hypothetical protein PP939_gp091 [Rhizobium phage RL38J1]|uniref:Uncharacterized protein n=1 Tax=Rhizobium phage RL38J1 TaxID=2663232 RepID=A0A6B9J156_9CAUD|nr:hypothetical protein PP939_gp091 [Rhizobium phage RL38J1]QGZ13999.1 hypothetical protein RL38J1_091 [Rhizobium phage RL38J1]
MEKQLRFDLGDRYTYLDALMEGKRIREYQDWRIYYSYNSKSYFLGIRSRGPVETDHDFVEKLSVNDAIWLHEHRHILPHVGVLDHLEQEKKAA